MTASKTFLGKVILSVSIIGLAILATLLLSEAIFPNPVKAVEQLLRGGAKITPHLQLLLLQMKLSQGLQTVGVFLVPALVAIYIFYGRKGVVLPLTNKIGGYDIFYVFFLILFSNTFLAVVAQYCQQLPWPKELVDGYAQNEKLTKLLLSGVGYNELALNILIICVLPAICEEYFFRGFLQRVMLKWIKDPHLCILLAAVVFSAFHFDAVNFLPRFLLGAMLGYLFYWTGSLWLPILAHFLNNAQVVVGLFVINKVQGGSFDSLEANFDISSFNLIVSVLLTGLLLLSIYRRYMNVGE